MVTLKPLDPWVTHHMGYRDPERDPLYLPAPESEAIILELPWQRPILSLNDRGATRGAAMAKASKIAELRQTTMAKALHANLPRGCTHVAVELHYRPRTNARRDTDNLFAVLKPIADGLVDAGLVADDDYTQMARPEPVIHRASKVPAMWLEITVYDQLRSHPE